MSTSTRIFLAVTAAIVVVLVLYYGVFSGDPAPQAVRAAEEPESTLPIQSEPTPDPVDRSSLRFDLPPAVEIRPVPAPEPEPQEDKPAGTEESGEAPLEELEPILLHASEDRDGGKDGPAPDSSEKQDEPAELAEESEPEPEPEPEPREPERPRTPPAAPEYTEYTVKANDTMSSIAEWWFGDAGKWDLISKANPLVDPARLRIGQVLRLPPKDTQREDPEERVGSHPVEYTVRSGDTLSKISRMYYGNERYWQRLFDANRAIIGDSPNNLRVGMKLTIPPAPSE